MGWEGKSVLTGLRCGVLLGVLFGTLQEFDGGCSFSTLQEFDGGCRVPRSTPNAPSTVVGRGLRGFNATFNGCPEAWC